VETRLNTAKPRPIRTWVLGGATLAVAAAGVFTLWLAAPDATALTDAAYALPDAWAGDVTVSAATFANVLGAACAAAGALGAGGQYFLARRR